MSILVFGSMGADLVTSVKSLPRPGETVSGSSFEEFAGGKGANQALAAKKAGSHVYMAGAVGDDVYAYTALKNLKANNVDLFLVERLPLPTGIATIFVDEKGQNCIAVYPGANSRANQATISDETLDSVDIVVLQHECDLTQNSLLAKRARLKNKTVILNAAPAYPLTADNLSQISYLIVNETEADFLAKQYGFSAKDVFCIQAFHKFGCKVVLTLGDKGALYFDGLTQKQVSAPVVNVVDTTGAGDSFVGAFAAALDLKLSLDDAVKWGISAGSLSCEKKGAQSGIPSQVQILEMFKKV